MNPPGPVRQGLHGTDNYRAGEEMLKLHRQVGQLENALAEVAGNCAGKHLRCDKPNCRGRKVCGLPD